MFLHGYWRSSAAYRARIALTLKQLSVQHAFHHLRRNEQREPDYLRLKGCCPPWSWIVGAAS